MKKLDDEIRNEGSINPCEFTDLVEIKQQDNWSINSRFKIFNMKLIVLLNIFVLLSSAAKYQVPSIKANWHKAHELCSSLGQRLVSIESRDKQSELQTFLGTSDKFSDFSRLWIGASDLARPKFYSWVHTGRLVTYTNWAPNEPNGVNGTERCIEIKYDINLNTNYLWNDNNCETPFYFVCENIENNIEEFK
ncbi:perlucin-like [Uranotaenia lowii]|uniref:perlucin-like n=1 Tax=Uranotaenia lowii TaxID=190385 RepID=UPI00247A1475|nr:perlucin-like [Uranotaenia lowii]